MVRPRAFKIADHVGWNSEARRVSGIIRRKISAPMQFKGGAKNPKPGACASRDS